MCGRKDVVEVVGYKKPVMTKRSQQQSRRPDLIPGTKAKFQDLVRPERIAKHFSHSSGFVCVYVCVCVCVCVLVRSYVQPKTTTVPGERVPDSVISIRWGWRRIAGEINDPERRFWVSS